MDQSSCYDILGVGFGPANLALAIALEEAGFEGRVLMCERRASSQWHPEMMMPGADIQNNPHRDLITPVNPRSRYSFLNFLHEHGMLLEHLNLGIEFPLRAEYASYVQWVASFFANWVAYDAAVVRIELHATAAGPLYKVIDQRGDCRWARSAVVAPGRTPLIPPVFAHVVGQRVFHLTEFLSSMRELQRGGPLRHVCVIGGSQSAAEIVLHLAEHAPQLRITNVMRGHGFRQKDTSPFSERAFLPEFVDYYYACDAPARARLDTALQFTNYSAVDGELVRRLYLRLYEDKLAGRQNLRILAHQNVIASEIGRDGRVRLHLEEVNTGERQSLDAADAVVLATGFRNLGAGDNQERAPPLLDDLADELLFDERGALRIGRDYRVGSRNPALPPLYLNGLCESTHGLGDAGSFSLLSLRAAEICRSVLHALQTPRRRALAEGMAGR